MYLPLNNAKTMMKEGLIFDELPVEIRNYAVNMYDNCSNLIGNDICFLYESAFNTSLGTKEARTNYKEADEFIKTVITLCSKTIKERDLLREHIINSYIERGTIKRWLDYKTVYAFDKELEKEFLKTDTIEIPIISDSKGICNLEYDTFYIELPENSSLNIGHGMYVFVGYNSQIITLSIVINEDYEDNLKRLTFAWVLPSPGEAPKILLNNTDTVFPEEDEESAANIKTLFYVCNFINYLLKENTKITQIEKELYNPTGNKFSYKYNEILKLKIE